MASRASEPRYAVVNPQRTLTSDRRLPALTGLNRKPFDTQSDPESPDAQPDKP